MNLRSHNRSPTLSVESVQRWMEDVDFDKYTASDQEVPKAEHVTNKDIV